MANAGPGWINRDRVGVYEQQENIFTGAIRHRVYKPYDFFHDWVDGEPPYKPLKEVEKDGRT